MTTIYLVLFITLAGLVDGGLIEERLLLRSSVRFAAHQQQNLAALTMITPTTTLDPRIAAEQAKLFYPSQHQGTNSEFRYCAETHLCECTPKTVSCKRLEINSTEFNKLQRPSLSQSNQYVLQELTVYRSNLSHLEAFSFSELRNLQRLSLRFNSIRVIHPDAMRGLFQLKTLDFRQNSLAYLPADVFTDLVQLEELDLSENNLNSIDANSLRPLLRLRKLSLAANDFKTIYAMQNLPRLPSLESLSLADNDLSEVTGETFSTMLPELRRLDLSSNRIQFASPHAFMNMPLLETVDFYANMLSYLDPAAFQTLRNLNQLLLGENPLVCDCKLQPLRVFYTQIVSLNPDSMQDRPVQARSAFSSRPQSSLSVTCETSHTCAPVCASPFFLKGHSFFDLSPTELACTTTTTTTTTTTPNTPKPPLPGNGYLALLSGENAGRGNVGGMLSAASSKGSRLIADNSTPRLPFAQSVSQSSFDETLAIAIGIITSVLLLTLLVVGTLCFRHYFYRQRQLRHRHQRVTNDSKDLSALSTGHLTGQSSSSNSDEATTSSSHSSSPGINQQSALPQKHLSLSVTSGLNGVVTRYPVVSSISYDAFGHHHHHHHHSTMRQQQSLADYASIFPGSSSFNPQPSDSYFISGDGKTTVLSTTNDPTNNNGLLLQTVLSANNNHHQSTKVGSIVTLASSNDLRTFHPNPIPTAVNVPRSESLV